MCVVLCVGVCVRQDVVLIYIYIYMCERHVRAHEHLRSCSLAHVYANARCIFTCAHSYSTHAHGRAYSHQPTHTRAHIHAGSVAASEALGVFVSTCVAALLVVLYSNACCIVVVIIITVITIIAFMTIVKDVLPFCRCN